MRRSKVIEISTSESGFWKAKIKLADSGIKSNSVTVEVMLCFVMNLEV